ncbi:MAG: hypothetical protein QF922_01440, partial [SAR324 cluster bacterium]|nr:hypothetical protein [SAR324 cluster bacterium]
MPPDASLDLLCLGEPLMELNQVRGVEHYLPGFGGDTSNCAVAAARQGARVGYARHGLRSGYPCPPAPS